MKIDVSKINDYMEACIVFHDLRTEIIYHGKNYREELVKLVKNFPNEILDNAVYYYNKKRRRYIGMDASYAALHEGDVRFDEINLIYKKG